MLTFEQELIKAGLQVALPVVVLLVGGRWLLDRYEISRKRREQEIELVRFVRERQYQALESIYSLFGRFMSSSMTPWMERPSSMDNVSSYLCWRETRKTTIIARAETTCDAH